MASGYFTTATTRRAYGPITSTSGRPERTPPTESAASAMPTEPTGV